MNMKCDAIIASEDIFCLNLDNLMSDLMYLCNVFNVVWLRFVTYPFVDISKQLTVHL